jgi:hypothetical protein
LGVETQLVADVLLCAQSVCVKHERAWRGLVRSCLNYLRVKRHPKHGRLGRSKKGLTEIPVGLVIQTSYVDNFPDRIRAGSWLLRRAEPYNSERERSQDDCEREFVHW